METHWYKDSKFDCYGNLVGRKKETFEVGCDVNFTYRKLVKKDGRTKQIMIKLNGIWDGEKVCFNDKDETVVRTTEWLKIKPFEWGIDY